jgi:hypothetical protein
VERLNKPRVVGKVVYGQGLTCLLTSSQRSRPSECIVKDQTIVEERPGKGGEVDLSQQDGFPSIDGTPFLDDGQDERIETRHFGIFCQDAETHLSTPVRRDPFTDDHWEEVGIVCVLIFGVWGVERMQLKEPLAHGFDESPSTGKGNGCIIENNDQEMGSVLANSQGRHVEHLNEAISGAGRVFHDDLAAQALAQAILHGFVQKTRVLVDTHGVAAANEDTSDLRNIRSLRSEPNVSR